MPWSCEIASLGNELQLDHLIPSSCEDQTILEDLYYPHPHQYDWHPGLPIFSKGAMLKVSGIEVMFFGEVFIEGNRVPRGAARLL